MKTLVTALTVALYLVFLSFQPALAGAPPLQWQKTFGGKFPPETHERGRSVQQTSDGGYIIASESGSECPPPYFECSSVDLIKTDPDGDIKWIKYFGYPVNSGYSVQQTSDGGYIIAGYTYSFGTESLDVYLIKTDPNGNSQWQKTFGGSGRDVGHSVQQTSDGGYIIAGSIDSYGTDADVYVIKTDSGGNLQWQKTFGGIYGDWGRSVQQTTDGGYIIAGYTNSYGAGDNDVYLIKTDPNGNKKWQKTFGGSDSEHGSSVQQTSDGGYIITGITWSYGAGWADVYLIKTDPNGDSQWQKTFGGSDPDTGSSIQQTSDSGYIITGSTVSYGAGGDVYLIKTDPNGNSQWQMTFGGSKSDHGYSVQQTSDGGYIIAGRTESYGAVYGAVYLIKLCSDGTLSADFNCNGTVYFEDLKVLVDQWLQPPGILSADIAPEPGDGIVNFLDFRILANDWLQSTIP
ncbi:MAG TPA: hypothetical protein VMY06_09670 [Sedimentisphaerales bacterium]|nr:hypothetical protein [Sedimentisphaerales bacterium]